MTINKAHTVPVQLETSSYNIHIQAGLLGHCSDILAQHIHSRKALIISDDTVAALHAENLQNTLSAAGIEHALHTFPAGELSKNIQTLENIYQACARHRIDRSSCLIALGGGVVGDICGFAAATWMRGISFVQIPTSLLAMVDSSVGGKTGVNSSAGKNLIGAFKQPQTVIIDPQLMSTMAPREYKSGLAEVCKCGVIHDLDFFTWQEDNAEALVAQDLEAVAYAVAHSCRSKAWYVGEDEREQGVRAHLNYGHTFGHALERHTQYKKYLHGEAVAIGMAMAAQLSHNIGILENNELIHRQNTLLEKFDLPIMHQDSTAGLPQILSDHCLLDKKVSNGRTRFIGVHDFANISIIENPDAAAVNAAFSSGIRADT